MLQVGGGLVVGALAGAVVAEGFEVVAKYVEALDNQSEAMYYCGQGVRVLSGLLGASGLVTVSVLGAPVLGLFGVVALGCGSIILMLRAADGIQKAVERRERLVEARATFDFWTKRLFTDQECVVLLQKLKATEKPISVVYAHYLGRAGHDARKRRVTEANFHRFMAKALATDDFPQQLVYPNPFDD